MKKPNRNKNIVVTKASGLASTYNQEKIKRSLKRAGASEEQASDIAETVSSKLYNGIPTREIFKIAFRLLKEQSRHLAARYNLKKAIMELGPSGFPFEKYMAEVFKIQGYQVSTSIILQGNCVNHEIDIIASLQEKQLLIECKYHSQQGIFSDVKVPLYIHSRFNDVVALLPSHRQYQGWIITNTRFSGDAMRYGSCAGLHLMSWDYPSNASLRSKIDGLGLYPVTCLTSLTLAEKAWLLERNKVLCREIQANPGLLEQAGLSPSRIGTALQEVNNLCHTFKNSNTPYTGTTPA